MRLRLASYNLENLDDRAGAEPPLAARIAALKPHFQRLAADVICLQEVNSQAAPGQPRNLHALEQLLAATPYHDFHRAVTLNDAGTQVRDVQNLVVLSRFPVLAQRQVMHDLVPPPLYRPVTAVPAAAAAPAPVRWDRPILHLRLDIGRRRPLDLVNLHLRAPLAAFIAGQKAGAFAWNSVGGWAEGFFLAALKRDGQALETRLLLEQLFDADPEAWIAVCGDFNADGRATPLSLIRGDVEATGNGALLGRSLVPLEVSVPAERRYTVRHFGDKLLLDHVMVSRQLLGFFRQAEIHNESLTDELLAFATGRRDPDSFHAPVVVEFDID